MDEMQAFYDAILPRMADIIEYCNGFDLDDLPDDARNLLLLTFAFCEASFPVEAWRQPGCPTVVPPTSRWSANRRSDRCTVWSRHAASSHRQHCSLDRHHHVPRTLRPGSTATGI